MSDERVVRDSEELTDEVLDEVSGGANRGSGLAGIRGAAENIGPQVGKEQKGGTHFVWPSIN